MDFNLYLPIKVVSGKGAVEKNSFLLSSFGKRCIIVTGGRSALLSGALSDVTSALERQGIEYIIFDKITQNPRLDHCREGGKICREFGGEFVVGIGGGSPLDAAKAVAVYASNEDFSEENIYSQNERKKALPIIAVGTTAGTGSEVGRVSVLTNPKTGRKKSISPSDCFPSLTFADPTYTHSMPFSVTVSTALDALCHALEGYMSVKCSDIPALFAEKAFTLLWNEIKALSERKELPDEKGREALYYGSLCAGITLSYCGTAFPHPLGYILTENYELPHGEACAVFLDEFIKRSERFERKKTERAFEIMKTDESEFLFVISSLLPERKVKMTKEKIEAFCERFDVIPNNFKFSPGLFTKEDAVKIFEKKFLD